MPVETALPNTGSNLHCLDTSAVIVMMRRKQPAGAGALLPFTTIGELSVGDFRSIDPSSEWRRIELTLSAAAGIVYPTPRTLLIYGELTAKLQRIGMPVPTNDLWIAAVAVELDLSLWANDEHFSRVPGLRVVRL